MVLQASRARVRQETHEARRPCRPRPLHQSQVQEDLHLLAHLLSGALVHAVQQRGRRSLPAHVRAVPQGLKEPQIHHLADQRIPHDDVRGADRQHARVRVDLGHDFAWRTVAAHPFRCSGEYRLLR